MANIAIFRTNQTPEYLKSVNTPDYEGDGDVLINPDISALVGIPVKYWKRVNGVVEEMSGAEKQAVDDAELTKKKDEADNFNVDTKTVLTALIKVINKRIPGNPITQQEMITAIKAEIT